MSISNATRTTLTNGLRVANFSSPHPFNFVDGSVIERCDPERVAALSLNTENSVQTIDVSGKFFNIEIKWDMPEPVALALDALEDDPEIDVVLVPLPVMTAIKQERARLSNPAVVAFGHKLEELAGLEPESETELWSKARVIRVADRETKAIHIDKFCV